MSDILEIKSYKRQYYVKHIDNLKTVDIILKDDFVIIDKNVYNLYPELKNKLGKRIYLLEANENNKCLNQAETIIAALVEGGFKKNHRLVAIGGGVTQDVVGFVASVLYRGVEWIFFPTTLLAQADSCIGSKTSINFNGVKNLLGTFYPPSNIYCCREFLTTLSQEDIKSGIGEMLHYFLIYDLEKAEEMMLQYEEITTGQYDLLNKYIKASLAMKKQIIEIDEFDSGVRRLYNYGHTFGHAIETITNYKICHGQAVTLGMDIANFVSYRMNLIEKPLYDRLHSILKSNMPEYEISHDNIDRYMKLLSKDKKNIDNSIVCILPTAEEKVEVKEISDKQTLKNYVNEYFERREDEHSKEQ
jgi:3-dehydroquinate synthase|tara:strand:+ start:592 stop:1668 length:1077 start_codon:yes stop_codon:yes gene_type:complete